MTLKIETQKDLREHTSWKVGGPADFYCAPLNPQQVGEALLWAQERSLPITILGGGSNVLMSDRGVRGLLLHTVKLTGIQVLSEETQVRVEALGGTPKSDLLKYFLKKKLAPAIFLAGLPGDVAGGVVMNAGVGHQVQPREFVEIVESFEVMDLDEQNNLRTRWFARDEVQWDYRHSRGWQPGVITRVRLTWPNQPDGSVLESVKQGNQRRKLTQPLQWPSCGSVFKNPPGDHAGRLIEASGLKGFRIGDAMVSDKHANFVLNMGKATAIDLAKVIRHVEQTVLKLHQIRLTNEVVYLGEWLTEDLEL